MISDKVKGGWTPVMLRSTDRWIMTSIPPGKIPTVVYVKKIDAYFALLHDCSSVIYEEIESPLEI